MKCLDVTYVAYDSKSPYLPCFVCDSITEMALFLCCTREYLWACIKYDIPCCGREVKAFYGLDKMVD